MEEVLEMVIDVGVNGFDGLGEADLASLVVGADALEGVRGELAEDDGKLTAVEFEDG